MTHLSASKRRSVWTDLAALVAGAVGLTGVMSGLSLALSSYGFLTPSLFSLSVGIMPPIMMPQSFSPWYFGLLAAANAGQLLAAGVALRDRDRFSLVLTTYQALYLVGVTGLNVLFSNGEFVFPLGILQALLVSGTLFVLAGLGKRQGITSGSAPVVPAARWHIKRPHALLSPPVSCE